MLLIFVFESHSYVDSQPFILPHISRLPSQSQFGGSVVSTVDAVCIAKRMRRQDATEGDYLISEMPSPRKSDDYTHSTTKISLCLFCAVFLALSSQVMPKRFLDGGDDTVPIPKRMRSECTDRLSILSDELLLRTLSFLSISDLVLCERCAQSTSYITQRLTMQALSTHKIFSCGCAIMESTLLRQIRSPTSLAYPGYS